MPKDSALRRFDAALQAAALRYGDGLRAGEPGAPSGWEAQSLIARLGLPPGILAPPRHDTPTPAASTHEAALARLRMESRRLARLARVRHPTYDLNRHIAVRRLISALVPAAAPSGPMSKHEPTVDSRPQNQHRRRSAPDDVSTAPTSPPR